MRVVVVGAGPIGVAAALLASERGHAVTLVEAGVVGQSLRRWGRRTRFFTPLAMNLPPSLLARVPAELHQALLSGPEMATLVLEPLAVLLGERLRLHTRLRSVGRVRLSRIDLPAHPLRAERPFRLLVDGPHGEEYLEADRVLDASGTYGQPLAAGAGGLAALGEAKLGGRIHHHLDALDLALGRLLVLGHGLSAATALVQLSEAPPTEVTWAIRSAHLRPIVETACDPLPERQRIATLANQLASSPPSWLHVHRRTQLEALATDGDAVRARLTNGIELHVDQVLSFTGYRPDLRPLDELALDIAADTEGPQRLHRKVATVTDCLSLPSVTRSDLESGEPGFHFLGQKSYGRGRSFLLQTGLAHLEQLLDAMI